MKDGKRSTANTLLTDERSKNMKNFVKVYIEWINYEGKPQSRDLIATFCSIQRAKDYVEKEEDYDDRFSRLIIEE